MKKRIKISFKRRKGNHGNGAFRVSFRDPRELQDPSDRSKGYRPVNRSLGTRDKDEAELLVSKLREIVNNKELHEFLPADTPERVRRIWLGKIHDIKVKTKLGTVELPYSENAEKDLQLEDTRDEGSIKNFLFDSNDDPPDPNEYLRLVETEYGHDADLTTLAEKLIQYEAELQRLRDTSTELRLSLKDAEKKIELSKFKDELADNKIKKLRKISTLGEEAKKYLVHHTSTDVKKVWKSKVRSAVRRFVDSFGSERKTLEVDEKEVSRYVQTYKMDNGQPPTAQSRQKIKQIICTFLADATLGAFDVGKVKSVGQQKVQAEKKEPVWLKPANAKKLVKAMYRLHGDYWGDLASFQLFTGFRASEIAIILKKNVKPFDNGSRTKRRGKYEIQLVRLKDERDGTYIGKTGDRAVQGRNELDQIIERRLALSDGVFLFNRIKRYTPKTNKLIKRKDGATGLLADAWNQEAFFREYLRRLRTAANEAEIAEQIRCHLLRRTFASIAIRNGKSYEEVAALLGNDPKTCRKHYARLRPNEISTEFPFD